MGDDVDEETNHAIAQFKQTVDGGAESAKLAASVTVEALLLSAIKKKSRQVVREQLVAATPIEAMIEPNILEAARNLLTSE